ncbi:unnamed protein product, partial [marine sediment metagenome]
PLSTNYSDDIFIAKYDENGNYKWAIKAGGYRWDRGYMITTDKNDNIYVTGEFQDTAAFGDISLTSISDEDIFIAKLKEIANNIDEIAIDELNIKLYPNPTFHWIINNQSCIDTSAAINIYFIEQPYPEAYQERYDTACGDIYVLDGFQSIDTSVITWSSESDKILFASSGWDITGDTIHDTVMYNLTLPQIGNIFLTEANGMCTTRDTITVTFSRIPDSEFKFVQPKCFHYSFEIQAKEDTLSGYPELPGFQWDFG